MLNFRVFSLIDEIATVSVESRHCSGAQTPCDRLRALGNMRIRKVGFDVMKARQAETRSY